MVDRVSAWSRAGWWWPAIRTAAVAVPLATSAVLATVRDHVTSESAVLVLVLWVVVAAATGDRVAAVLAALSGGAWFDFFLTQPYGTFAIDDADDIEATVLLVVISLVVTEVALWGRRQQDQASRRSGYLDGVVDVASSVAEGETPSATVIDVVARQISQVLAVDSCRYVPGPVHDARIGLLDHHGTLTRDGRAVDVERVGLPSEEYVAVPVRRENRVVGHFLVSATSRVTYPTREQRRVAVLLADQVASALDDESA